MFQIVSYSLKTQNLGVLKALWQKKRVEIFRSYLTSTDLEFCFYCFRDGLKCTEKKATYSMNSASDSCYGLKHYERA